MKKALLLVAAATIATAASAQHAAVATNASLENVAMAENECAAEEALSMEDNVQTAEAVKAWYNRPAGTFYLTNLSTEGKNGYSSYYAPYLMLHPYESYTFKSASTGASSQTWKVWYQERLEATSTEESGESFDRKWKLEIDTVPALTVKGADGTESLYQLGGYNGSTHYFTYISTYPGVVAQLKPSTTETRHIWASPKFFAARSNRDGSKTAGAYYGNLSANAGKLLGKNTDGIDAMAVAVEKPTHPYAIKAVGVRFQNLQMASSTAQTKIVANIYAVDNIPSYVDKYVTITPGKMLATASINLSENIIVNTPEYNKSTTTGQYSGLMYIPLEENLNVEEPILVEITGYNNENIADFTSLYSADYFEEGYGEIGYVKRNGVYMSMRGSYINAANSTAPAILLEVENPYLTWNMTNETGEAAFDKDGGSKEVSIFTYYPSADMKLASEDGSALPDWVTATVEDVLNSGEFDYVSTLKVDVKPLPEGTNYREASVKISYPGAKLVYRIKQGEPTGVSEVAVSDAQVDVVEGNFVVNTPVACAVEIYGVAGQLVGKAQAAQGTSVVDAQQLAGGVYIVKVGDAIVKVVK